MKKESWKTVEEWHEEEVDRLKEAAMVTLEVEHDATAATVFATLHVGAQLSVLADELRMLREAIRHE